MVLDLEMLGFELENGLFTKYSCKQKGVEMCLSFNVVKDKFLLGLFYIDRNFCESVEMPLELKNIQDVKDFWRLATGEEL